MSSKSKRETGNESTWKYYGVKKREEVSTILPYLPYSFFMIGIRILMLVYYQYAHWISF